MERTFNDGQGILKFAARWTGYLAIGCLVAGCGVKIATNPHVTAAKAAATQAAATVAIVKAGVDTSSKNVGDVSKGIQADVATGRAKTPPAAKPDLEPVWASLSARALALWDQSSALVNLSSKVDTLNTSVNTLISSNTALAADADAAQKAAAVAQATAAKANSQAAHLTALLYVAALAGIGAFVFLSLLTKNITIGVAGVGGCGAILLATSIFGRVDAAIGELFRFAWIGLAVAVTWFIADVLWRKFGPEKLGWGAALLKAIETNPVQDVEDVLKDLNMKLPQVLGGAASKVGGAL